MINYGFTKEVDMTFEEALEAIPKKLKEEGFGILTKIDLKEKLKEKLGIDFKNYVILGACNPPLAYRALLGEKNIGLLLPCNVIVYEDEGKTFVSAIRPTVAMSMIGNPKLREVAEQVEGKLRKVVDGL